MARTKNMTNGKTAHNGHVSLAREEYEAFQALEDKLTTQAVESAKLLNRNLDLVQTVDTQVKHLANYELKVMHLERIAGLQGVLIDLLKDKEKVISLQDLSEFWRRWQIVTLNGIDDRRVDRVEVSKFEPDLFKMWRNWVNDYGKSARDLNFAGTRTEIDATSPQNQEMLKTHMLARSREENAKLMGRIQQLESELDDAKAVAAAAKVGVKP